MPNIAAARRSMMTYVPARLRSANMCSGVIGCLARGSIQDERGQQDDRRGEGAEGERVAPAVLRGADEPVHQRPPCRRWRSARRRCRSCPGWRSDSLMYSGGEDGEQDADRHVDEQHPAPVEPLGQHAAGEQADGAAARRAPRRRRRTPGCAPGPRRKVVVIRASAVGDGDGAADALEGAGGQQLPGVPGRVRRAARRG